MRRLDWLHILQQSRQWMLLLCANSGFFIFLAWVAYPESFKLLVVTMLIFTLISDFGRSAPCMEKTTEAKKQVLSIFKRAFR